MYKTLITYIAPTLQIKDVFMLDTLWLHSITSISLKLLSASTCMCLCPVRCLCFIACNIQVISLTRDVNIVCCMCRSYLLQHRLLRKEGDSSWECDSIECLGKHIKGEECTILASICINSWIRQHHRNKIRLIESRVEYWF